MPKISVIALLVAALALWPVAARPVQADELAVVRDGKTSAQIIVETQVATSAASPPGKAPLSWETRAARDLSTYIERLSGAKVPIVAAPAGGLAALQGNGPFLVLGAAALQDPSTKAALARVTPKNPVGRHDAVVVRRVGNRVFLAGSNDLSIYYAASWLLQRWGCRWYLPTEFGECIPETPTLTLGDLDTAYAPPFPVRNYWLAQKGDTAGYADFSTRNFFAPDVPVGSGFSSGPLAGTLLTDTGVKSAYEAPLGDPALAARVAEKLGPDYAAGKSVSVVLQQGAYTSTSPAFTALQTGIFNKYSLLPAQSDAMLAFDSQVARLLRAKYPDSHALVGGIAYNNLSMPPQRAFDVPPNLVMWLGMPDVDPNHSMNDTRSPAKQEYGAMLDRWAKVMGGRIVIYDYDQSQLVWRDLPAPTHTIFAEDVKRFRAAGILGFGTESRGASATTFFNLFFRGQLMWNPDTDTKAMQAEFYPKFYGPAAAPMNRYWNAIYGAWNNTIVTEHEYPLAPAIYTPALVDVLRANLEEAQKLMAPLSAKADPTRNEKLYLERLEFTMLSFAVIENYVAMGSKAAGMNDYAGAVSAGKKGLASRAELTAMNPIFTTTQLGENGPAWWPGEVEQYRHLQSLTDGRQGTLVAQIPLEWAFHRDPHDTGVARGWAYTPADLTYWNANKGKYTLESRKDYPTTQWETLRTDLYAQAQGVRHPDSQSFTGFTWYQTPLQLETAQTAGPVHLMFPGLFNECWLYVNGELVAHRAVTEPWWMNDYSFEWDVDLSSKLHPGANLITLRDNNPHHFGGMFRRPFLYRPVAPETENIITVPLP